MEELDGPSLEWDEEYVLSESPPLELCCDEDQLQVLKQEDLTETAEDQEKVQEVIGRAEGEAEATQDSGVETEELQRHSSLSHTTLPDEESQGENHEVNNYSFVSHITDCYHYCIQNWWFRL